MRGTRHTTGCWCVTTLMPTLNPCQDRWYVDSLYFGLIRCRSVGRGSDQDGNDEVRFGGLDCAKQGGGIDQMNHGGADGLPALPPADEVLVMLAALAEVGRGFTHLLAGSCRLRANLRIS